MRFPLYFPVTILTSGGYHDKPHLASGSNVLTGLVTLSIIGSAQREDLRLMNVIRTTGAGAESLAVGTCVTIGNFDGVHRGHQSLLAEVAAQKANGLKAGLVTFDPHPVAIIAPDKAPLRLCTLERRLEWVERSGLDFTLVIPFDKTFSQTEPEDFIADVLARQLKVQHLVVGPDCRFGKARRGDAALLRAESGRHGYTVQDMDPLMQGTIRVSSSAIRRALSEGRVEDAHAMLGRPHSVDGTVVPGDQRGRQLGFPTANLKPVERLLVPQAGVYSGRVSGSDLSGHPAVLNIGIRPTFGGAQTSVEIHLLNFSGDLYGQELSVTIQHRLRGEQKFGSVDELKTQIATDASAAESLLMGG